MAESSQGGNPHEIDLASQYGPEGGAGGVRGRFLVYPDNVDVEEIARELLALTGYETIVDIGTSDGSFPVGLSIVGSHIGRIIGIDPYDNQFNEFLPSYLVENGSESIYPVENIQLLKGDATSTPLPDNIADVVTAMNVLYHVENREGAYNEAKRLLKPDGRMVISTSGENNKSTHRLVERRVAKLLRIKPPELMNQGYTTEIASLELPQIFKRVFRKELYESKRIKPDDEVRKGLYLMSLMSLHEHYQPQVAYDSLLVVTRWVLKDIIESERGFVDHFHRSVFVVSDSDIEQPKGTEDISALNH